MPSVDDNLRAWDQGYDWPEEGEEWSKPWGGSLAQWTFFMFPRIQHFLPARKMLEIAPGHGRWTEYLRRYCDRFYGVDLSSNCVDFCRRRFANQRQLEFHVNDGYSLWMIEDRSIDFAFSFDSLVHAELDVLNGYLAELARTLSQSGIAFLHHSNMASILEASGLPSDITTNPDWRATTVSAAILARESPRHGLKCIAQELLNWSGAALSDCVTTLTRAGSRWDRELVVVENGQFNEAAANAARIAPMYLGNAV